MKMVFVAPIWVVGLGVMAVGAYVVLVCEWACDELKGFWA